MEVYSGVAAGLSPSTQLVLAIFLLRTGEIDLMDQLAVSHVHGDEEIGNEEKCPYSYLHSVEQSVNPGGEILKL